MSKNVLVIGGSYFVGRVFMLMAAAGRFTGDFTFHLLNRGRYSLKLPGVTEHVCNRHDPERLARLLPALDWEAVIDFCAYSPGDIQTLLEALPGTLRQFIYISTCSVYEPHTPSPKKESSPKLERGGDDPGLAYAYNKLLLEKEAFRSCAVKDAALTILRPSFIYGPFNYAPREPYYFELILHKKPIPAPTDATGRFNFVYVKDSARMLAACIGNPLVFDQAHNMAAPEIITYELFLDVLREIHGAPLEIQPVTVREVYARNLPLPFPLDSDELFAGGALADKLGLSYTPFLDGMKESYAAYMPRGQG